MIDARAPFCLMNSGARLAFADLFLLTCLARPDPAIPYNTAMYDVADFIYLPVNILLVSFREVLQPGQAPVYKKGYFGTYDPNARRERMSTSQKFNEDKIVLLEILPEFAFMAGAKIKLPVQDATTKALVEFVKDKRVTVWHCFTTQILLDVHHALRHTKDRAFDDLRLYGLRTKKTIEEH